jgi:membrane protease YdiL (CAAX protease family)
VSLVVFCAGHLALIAVALTVFEGTWFDPLVRATNGLVNDTLLVNLLGLPLLVGAVVLWLGHLRPADVGLRRADLPLALAVLLLLWLATQAIALAVACATTDAVTPHPLWARRGVSGVLGLLLAQVFGNAVLEEVGYRGFLLRQLHLRLDRVAGRRTRVVLAVTISQALFAVMHLPNRLREGDAGAGLVWSVLIAFGLGVLLALLYLRTNNLLLVVGVHALINTPTLLVASPVSHEIVEGLAVLLLVPWSRITRPTLRRTGHRGTGPT